MQRIDMKKKNLVVFSGAGMSAESGLHTFRDSGGLWESNRIEDVATPEAWQRNPQKVIDFYNLRFHQLQKVVPNDAHLSIAELESVFNVQIVTQNVDNLHERAGSSKVLHLHGELSKCRSSGDKDYIIDMPESGLSLGMTCPRGFQLRPHVVWFGEEVPEMINASNLVSQADILLVIGTSLNVYPAAGLVYSRKTNSSIFLIDPAVPNIDGNINFTHIKKPASEGMREFREMVLSKK